MSPIRRLVRRRRKGSNALLIGLALGCAAPGLAASGQVSIVSTTATSGAVVSVNVVADGNVQGLAAATLTVGYPSELQIDGDPKTSIAFGTFFPGAVYPQPGAGIVRAINATKPNLVTVVLASARGHSGPGTIATIPFDVPAGAADGSRFDLTLNASFYDENGAAVTESVVGGAIQVVVPPPPPTVKVQVEDATGVPGGGVLIGVDVDAHAHDLIDARLSLRYGGALLVDQARQVMIGPLMSGPGAATVADLTVPGAIGIDLTAASSSPGPGTLVTMFARIPGGTPPGQYPLALASAALTTVGGAVLPSSTIDGTLTVVPGDAPAVTVRDAVGSPGRTVTVELDGDAGLRGVASALLAIDFGPIGVPDVSALTAGPLVGGDAALTNGNDSILGRVTIGLVSVKPHNGPGMLVTFPLHIHPATLPGIYPLLLTQVSLNDPRADSVAARPVSGNLTVLAPVRGDADGDGKVTVKDATIALRIAVGLDPATADQISAIDFNGDGHVSIADVTLVLRAALGLTGG